MQNNETKAAPVGGREAFEAWFFCPSNSLLAEWEDAAWEAFQAGATHQRQQGAGVVMPDWLDSYSAMAERLLKAGWKDSGDAQWAGIAEMHNEFARLNGKEESCKR